jgi:hypothetical protein
MSKLLKREQLVRQLEWRKRAAREAGDYLRMAENTVLQRRDEAAAAAQRVANAEVALREYDAERELARKRKPILVLRYFGGELHVASVKLHAASKYPQVQQIAKPDSAGQTTGHRDDQPGLRGHSVGDIYPFVIQRRAVGGKREVFDLLHVTSGIETRNFQTYDLAFGCALHRLARPYNRPSKWYSDARKYGATSISMYADEYARYRCRK